MAEEMPADSRADRSGMRFEATLHRGSAVVDDTADLADLDDLDLDRVPDPDGGVRLLADLDQCVRLVERGFEVRLLRAVPIQPLDPGSVFSDDAAQAWLDERLRAARAAGAT
jgi:hypothetical protein